MRTLLVLLLVPAACAPIFMLGEKAASDCSGMSYEEMEKESYRLVRRQGKSEESLPVRLRVYRDCRVDPGMDLSPLQVKGLYFSHSTSRVPELVLQLSENDADGNPLVCTASFELGRALVFACPEGYYYTLQPES